jgi:hypothetical protein
VHAKRLATAGGLGPRHRGSGHSADPTGLLSDDIAAFASNMAAVEVSEIHAVRGEDA